jgi:hypothetical protein
MAAVESCSNIDLDFYSKDFLAELATSVSDEEPQVSVHAVVDYYQGRKAYFEEAGTYDPKFVDLITRVVDAWYERKYDPDLYPDKLFEIPQRGTQASRPNPSRHDPLSDVDFEIVDFQSKLVQIFEVLTFNEQIFVANSAINHYLSAVTSSYFKIYGGTGLHLIRNQTAVLNVFSALKEAEFNLDEEEEFTNQCNAGITPIRIQLERMRRHQWQRGVFKAKPQDPWYDDPVADQILDLFKVTMIKSANFNRPTFVEAKFSRAQIIEALRKTGVNPKLAAARLLRT